MKNYLIKLNHLFAFKNIKGCCIYIFIIQSLFIYLFVKKTYWVVIIIILCLLCFYLYNRSLFSYCIISLFIVTTFLIINYISYNNNQNIRLLEENVEVTKVITYDDYQKVYIKCKSGRYYFNTNDLIYQSGDILYIKGEVELAKREHYDNGIDYQAYLRYQNIKGKVINLEIKKLNSKFSLNVIHEKVNNYISNTFSKDSAVLIQALIIGEKHNMNIDLQNNIQKVGIGHLFVISGLHIEIINKGLDKFLSIFKLKSRFKNIIILCFLLFYYILTSFIVSILRVIIGFIFNRILKKNLINLTPIDKLSLNAIIVTLINPFYLFSYSFLLSYTIVFGILLISPKLKKEKNLKSYLYNNIVISCVSTIISFPIVISINNDLNLLSIIYNLFFIPFVSYVLLPLSFITFLIPPLDYVYKLVAKFFITFTQMLSSVDIFTINFSYINLFCVVIFYLLFLLVFTNKKYKFKRYFLFGFMLFIIILYIKPVFKITDEIVFIDLPSGEATLISSKFNQTNILIDTGDLDASDLVAYLKTKGIKKFDAIIISHGDSDHIGGLRTLVNEFKIKNIYLSYYDIESINEITKYRFSDTKIYYLKKGDNLKIGSCVINVLWPSKNQHDVNNNSLVLLCKVFGISILFTGDIEQDAEKQFVYENKLINVDILKLAHHGSKTSTTEIFLKSIKFKYAVGMNGYQNTFGFPHSLVVNRLKKIDNIKLYNTLDYGSITFSRSIFDKRLKISTSFK